MQQASSYAPPKNCISDLKVKAIAILTTTTTTTTNEEKPLKWLQTSNCFLSWYERRWKKLKLSLSLGEANANWSFLKSAQKSVAWLFCWELVFLCWWSVADLRLGASICFLLLAAKEAAVRQRRKRNARANRNEKRQERWKKKKKAQISSSRAPNKRLLSALSWPFARVTDWQLACFLFCLRCFSVLM